MDVARARPDGEVSVVVVFSVFDGEGKHEVERERERERPKIWQVLRSENCNDPIESL